MINPLNFLVQYLLFHFLVSAVISFTATKDGVVGKAAILTGPAHIGVPAACFSRVDPGPCGRDIIRVFYDHKTYTCKAFSYSGCGGNMNRFVSVKNCYKLCHPYYRQRPAVIMDPGSTTPAPSTTAAPTTTAAAGSTTPLTIPIFPGQGPEFPGPIFPGQVPEFPGPIIQGPPMSSRTGYIPMGMMPMQQGMGYGSPYGQSGYGYGRKK